VHFSVPHHSREMKRSTLAKILKHAKIGLEEFLQHDP
jgi:predicted RNA binding protein YcfA (HicA-like mRNA interferase family)